MSDASTCQFGCTEDDVAVHNGWFQCTPESRAALALERGYIKLAEQQATDAGRAVAETRRARRDRGAERRE